MDHQKSRLKQKKPLADEVVDSGDPAGGSFQNIFFFFLTRGCLLSPRIWVGSWWKCRHNLKSRSSTLFGALRLAVASPRCLSHPVFNFSPAAEAGTPRGNLWNGGCGFWQRLFLLIWSTVLKQKSIARKLNYTYEFTHEQVSRAFLAHK